MARKKQENLFSLLIGMPLWFIFAFAAFTYVGLKYLLPAIVPTHNLFLGPLVKAISGNAGYFALLVLFAAPISFLNQINRRRLLDTQKDLDSIRAMSWQDFELLTGEVFRRNGFSIDERGGVGPDGGIDLVIRKNGKRHIVQCKRWKTMQVGVSPVRELFGVMAAERADGCVFVTSGKYSQEARSFAENKPIWLIDGDELTKLVKGVQQTKAVESLSGQVKSATPIVRQSQADPAAVSFVNAEAPTCPRCGQVMVRRQSKKQSNIGSAFWGCSSYPKCRGIRQID